MQVQVGTPPGDREEAPGNQKVGRKIVEAWVPQLSAAVAIRDKC